ncbi:MAG TPA: sigma-E factor negative regulatory protein [Steroidobacteraceae bacterium]|nr:sigma-E factor negative regulatory protein [Steroidobacteraceae bacterium]
MSNEELDSQLSAMFDDELPAPQCELLARRLARDDALKARWGRYAAMGAAIRAERSLSLDSGLARRVSTAIAAEPVLVAVPAPDARSPHARATAARWWQPLLGGALAAGVAAAAILWLHAAAPVVPAVAQLAATVPDAVTTQSVASDAADSDSYVVPPAVESASFAPPTELADFVVAHSEFSTPLLRRSALSALVAAEAATSTPTPPPQSAPHGQRQDESKAVHAAGAP